jgi:hypothetical protein
MLVLEMGLVLGKLGNPEIQPRRPETEKPILLTIAEIHLMRSSPYELGI